MAWTSTRGGMASCNGSLDFLDGNSPGSSRGPSPYDRPSARMDQNYGEPLQSFPRNFSRDSINSGDERAPPAKRRPLAGPSTFSTPLTPGKPTNLAKSKSTIVIRKAHPEKRGVNADCDDLRLKDSKYAASGGPRHTKIQNTAVQNLEASLLKSLLVPTKSTDQPVLNIVRGPVRKVQRASWTPLGRKNPLSLEVAPKVVARCSTTKISTLTELPDTELKSKTWNKASSSDSDSDMDEIAELAGQLRGGKGPLRCVSSAKVRRTRGVVEIIPKKGSLNLPLLTTKDEKDLLSEIFEEWQKDALEEEEKERSRSTALSGMLDQNGKVVPREEMVIEMDEDSDSEPMGDSLKVHMNLGSLPVYNAATYCNAPANSLPRVSLLKTEKPKPSRHLAEITRANGSDGFKLEKIMAALPGNPEKWRVSKQDEMRKDGKYLQQREERQARVGAPPWKNTQERLNVCHRCGIDYRKGHSCHTDCDLCHGMDHRKDRCPFKDTIRMFKCTRCGLVGHVDAICPEQWRQYHNTTSHSGSIKKPPSKSVGGVKFPCCFNCGKAEHYGHDCRKRQFDHKPLPIPNPLVKFYDDPEKLHQLASEMDQHPLDEFHEFVTNNMTEQDSELMSGMRGRKTRSVPALGAPLMPLRGAPLGGSPKKKKKMRNMV